MLSAPENDFLCRTGAETPMGALMREYWIPALQSQELPTPDGPPLRFRLLNENLAQEQNALRKIQTVGKRLAQQGAATAAA